MKIAVIGTGYVGLVTGTCLADSGQFVTCVDKDAAKIDTLRAGGIPIYEPGLEELVRRNVKDGRLAFSTSLAEVVAASEVVFIAVGTPPGETGDADLSHVLGAAEQIGRAITSYCVVVTKSTVPVGSSDQVAARIREVTKVPFDVVSNPEFLKEGSAVDDFMRPDRVVVGVASEKAKAIMADLYAPFVRTEHPILFMDTRSSELTKYAANAMLATRISFMNDIAAVCERTGADVDAVRRGMGADKRIGYPFLFPGAGFGGSCLHGKETVLVRRGERTHHVTLAHLYAEEGGSGEAPEAGAIAPSGLEVLSWLPGDDRPMFRPVAAITRRPFEGEALEVRTKMGRRVVCTPDHPFVAYSRDGATPSVKLARDLSGDDWLPLAQGSPETKREEKPLEVLSGMAAVEATDADVLVHPGPGATERLASMSPHELRARIEPLAHPRGIVARSQDIRRTGTLRLDELRAAGFGLDGAMVGTVKNGTYVPTTLAMDEAFWRVVGLYLSEGHCSADGRRRRLAWSFHPSREADLVEEVAGYWTRLGVKAAVRRLTTTMQVSVSSRLLAGFWLGTLGLGSDCYSHRIPDGAFSAPLAHRRALLSGLWRGDGSWSLISGGPSVALEYGTASLALADGMLRLLGDLGIVARQKIRRVSKSTVDTAWLTLSGAEQVERMLDLVPPRDRPGIEYSLARQKKRIAPTGYLRLASGVALVRVREVRPRRHRGFVYSLHVPGAETFVTTGGLVVHNCFPKDVRALMTLARKVGLDFDILRAVERVNERQKRLLVEKATKHFGSLSGRTFGVWGLAFKPKTDDMREAPSITLVEALLGAGATVKAHDPVAEQVARKLFGDRVRYTAEPYQAAEGADALFLVTEWNEFRRPDFERLARIMKTPVLFDGRNVWEPAKARAAGFTYFGIGRGAA